MSSESSSVKAPLLPPPALTIPQRQHSDHGHSHGGGHGHSHGSDHGHSHVSAAHAHSQGHSHAHATDSAVGHDKHVILATTRPNVSNSFVLNQARPIEWSLSLIINLFFSADSRPLVLYFTLKLFYAQLLFFVGLSLRLTSLISQSFHVLFDCAAMACSLYSVVQARQKPSFSYHYGYQRFEVTSAFTNAIFLYFVATFMAVELFHELTAGESNDDGNAKHTAEHQIVWLGLGIDLIGIVLFLRWALLPSLIQMTPTTTLTTQSHTHAAATVTQTPSLPSTVNPAHDVNMHSIWLFTVSDLIQHCLFLASTFLPSIIRSSLTMASSLSASHLHSLSYAITAVALVRLTTPLFKVTGRVLLQSTEDAARVALERAIREISFGDGVLEVRQANFWSQAPMSAASASSMSSTTSYIIGSVMVRCRSDCDSQSVLSDVHNCLGKLCSQLTVQIEKDSAPAWLTSNIG